MPLSRHEYIVPTVDRLSGADREIRVQAASAADAMAIVEAEHDVYVGSARRADGLSETAASPFGAPAYEEPDADGSGGAFQATVDAHSGPPKPALAASSSELRELIAIAKRSDERLYWLQWFGVITFWLVPMIGATVFALVFFLNLRDFGVTLRDFAKVMINRDVIIFILSFTVALVVAGKLMSSIRPRLSSR